ncbi:MAG: oligosaccharide flippase family protein, partial [bacterium]|nr:oligosaccharide flippase family protein [bacterium]
MIYGVGAVVTKAIGFVMIPIYTRYMSPKEYGLIEVLDATIYIISTVLTAGFGAAISKYYFYYKEENDRNQVISSALIFNLFIGIIGSVVLGFFSSYFSRVIFHTEEYTYCFQLMFATLFFEVCACTPFSYLRIKEASLLYVIITILRVILGLGLNIYFIVFLHLGIYGIFYSGLIVLLLSSIYLVYYTIKNVGNIFSFQKLKELLSFGWPLIPSNLGLYALNYSDRFFLNYFCALDKVGIYALGCKFGSILSMLVGQPFTLIWIAFRFEIADREDVKEIYARVLTYLEFVLIFLTLGLSLVIKDVVSIVAGKAFFEAHSVVSLVAISSLFFEATALFRIGIYLEKKTTWVPLTVWVPIFVTLILNWFIIPKYNVMGAGAIKIFAFFSMAAITYFVSQKFYPIPYEFNRILKMVSAAVIIYLINFLLPSASLWVSLILKSLLTLTFPVLLY